MNKIEREKLLKSYTEMKNDLIKTLDKHSVDCDIDIEGDQTDVIQGDALARVQTTLLKNYVKKLKAIQTSIKKINDEDFGLCEECEEFIGFKRLEALPGVTLCISCAENLEMAK